MSYVIDINSKTTQRFSYFNFLYFQRVEGSFKLYFMKKLLQVKKRVREAVRKGDDIILIWRFILEMKFEIAAVAVVLPADVCRSIANIMTSSGPASSI